MFCKALEGLHLRCIQPIISQVTHLLQIFAISVAMS